MTKKNLSVGLRSEINKIVKYTIPKYHEGKRCYVDFYCYDPSDDCMRRVKRYFDNIARKKERKTEAEIYINLILQRLRGGWNPFVNTNSTRGYTPLRETILKYREGLQKYTRQKTVHSYTSRVNVLLEYLDSLPYPPRFIYEFNSVFCNDFLDWLSLDREVSPRTRNNYKGWLSSLASWLIERKYITENPADSIKKIREDEKNRKALSSRELRTVFTHLKQKDKFFLLACFFEYFTFIRPTELSHIRINDISLKDMTVFVPGSVSKNRKDGKVSLNERLARLMIELGVLSKPGEWYLFGKNFRPMPERIGPDQFNKRWVKMRKELKLSEDLKFYSLKDSGIRDLANSEGVVVARDQARHQDVATTNKYLQGRDLNGPEGAKRFNGDFIL